MTEKQHAHRKAATEEQASEQAAREEGPAATYEHVQPDGADAAASIENMDADQLRAELETERGKANEYLDQWRRAAADLANFKRRTEQERTEMAKLFNESLVKAILPALDNFERALATVPEDLKGNGWIEGVALTEKQLRAALEKEGLQAIDALGQKFDPNLHEAVAHDISDEHEEDSVIEEFQRGYKLHDRVIRPSMVKVSRRS